MTRRNSLSQNPLHDLRPVLNVTLSVVARRGVARAEAAVRPTGIASGTLFEPGH